jgi:hypothetical protein
VMSDTMRRSGKTWPGSISLGDSNDKENVFLKNRGFN